MSKKQKEVSAKQQAPKPEKLSRKEKKRRKKQLRAEQLALEKQLVAEGKIPVRNKYVARGFFWRVFALCIAFVFGLFAAIGGLLGFTAFMPVKSVLGLFNVNYESLLNREYAEQSIFDLAKSIAGNPFSSLSDVAKYTPVLDKYLDQLNTSLVDLGVHVDLETLKATKFNELGSYFKTDVLNSVVLGDTMGIKPGDDQLIISLLYGKEGTNEEGGDYTVQDGKFVMNEGKTALTVGDLGSVSSRIENMYVDSVLPITADSPAAMRYLAYGTEGVHYKIEDGKVVMLENEITGEKYEKRTISSLQKESDDIINNAKISDLVTVEGDTGILSAIKDWKVSELQQTYRIKRLRLNQIIDMSGSTSKIMQAISGWRIGDLLDSKKMDSLTLGDLIAMDESTPLILRSLEHTCIGDFGTAVNNLRLGDILSEQDLAGNGFLKNLGKSTLVTLADDIAALSAADVYGADLYSYLSLKPESANGGKTYSEILKAFDHENQNSEIPHPLTLNAGDKVTEYFVPSSTGSPRLTRGYLAGSEGAYTVYPEKDVFAEKTDGALRYYVNGETKLVIEEYGWKCVNYNGEGSLDSLPEGDSISTDTSGYTVRTAEGKPFTDGAGEPFYYLTTLTTASGEENVAYPVLEDGFGIYYSCIAPDEKGAYDLRRFDLEYEPVRLSVENEPTVTYSLTDGKWQGAEGEVTVYEKSAEAGKEGSYYYLKTRTDVAMHYYAAPAEGSTVTTVFDDKDVTAKYEVVQGSETIPADRYLSGVWYLMFGGEDEHGNPVDNSELPILELTKVMPGISEKISTTPLYKLYLHGLITENPYVQLPNSGLFSDGVDVGTDEQPKKVKNLNECTVLECIKLVGAFVSALKLG